MIGMLPSANMRTKMLVINRHSQEYFQTEFASLKKKSNANSHVRARKNFKTLQLYSIDIQGDFEQGK